MSKKFNITGKCHVNKHYMADTSQKLAQTLAMIASGDYFIINRPRQYGKTTLLYAVADSLHRADEYLVCNISFEGVGELVFQEETSFCNAFIHLLATYAEIHDQQLHQWLLDVANEARNIGTLSTIISQFVNQTAKKVVLMIDEVDKSSNNQLFLDFLGMLRNKYLSQDDYKTFHAVVLAGVHDVKSLKLKLRPDVEQKYNSPWNIAADYNIDLNLYPHEIKPMLDEYSVAKSVKMDTLLMSEWIFDYTSGYPFLVSKLCKIMDEFILPTKITQDWTLNDLEIAVKRLVGESNTNFDSLVKNLENNENLYQLAYNIAVEGKSVPFNIHEPTTNLGALYGILYGIFVNKNGLAIHNKIYKEVMVNYMIAGMTRVQLAKGYDFGGGYKNPDNSLNMEAVLTKFQAFMREQYHKKDRDFIEREGRLIFLAFLKPILNGSGYDFKEVQISEERRLDVTITYFQYKYVAELKIWRGAKAHKEGLAQLLDYLDRLALDKGYLIIFDHAEIKEWAIKRIRIKGKKIFAVWV
jgi:AAA-like domain